MTIPHNPYSNVIPPPPPYPAPPSYEISQLPPAYSSLRILPYSCRPIAHFPCVIDSWQQELSRLLEDSTQASPRELTVFVHGTANFLRLRPRESSETSFEAGLRLYQKFLRQNPSCQEMRDFSISYIEFMGALTFDDHKLCGVYQQICEDAQVRAYPIPWSLGVYLRDRLISDSKEQRIHGRYLPLNRLVLRQDRGELIQVIYFLFQQNVSSSWGAFPCYEQSLIHSVRNDLHHFQSNRDLRPWYKTWALRTISELDQIPLISRV